MELSSRLLRQARIEREYTVMKKALNKKVLSVLIAAVILLVTAFPVLAADPFKLTSSAEAKDSVVTVKIYLPQNTELGTLSFTLKYDTKLLTYVSAVNTSIDLSEAALMPAATDETVSSEGKTVKAGKIPKTSGKYAAIGSAAAVLCVAAAAVAITVKRKRK